MHVSQGVFLFFLRPNGAFLAVEPVLREAREQDARRSLLRIRRGHHE